MKPWPKVIIHVDMNAFFASVEQLDNPLLRGQPIGITNGEQGSCIITCSYEARAYGIKTGMRVREALERCPHFIKVPSNPHRYTEISTRIMNALHSITPTLEIFSIDEALVDAKKRGIEVLAILDKSQQRAKYTSATYLFNQGILIWIDYKPAIAHNKVIIVDEKTVITGSFNFTKAAQYKNAENVLIITDKTLAKYYLENFTVRMRYSKPYQKYQ